MKTTSILFIYLFIIIVAFCSRYSTLERHGVKA